MNSTATRVQLIQCQIEIAKAMLLCGELVEHDAKWLKNAKTVVRDKSGKFASKAASIKEDAQAVVKTGGDILNISADAISNMVKDPGFRERAGLGTSAMIGKSIGNLFAQAKIFPGLEVQIDKLIKEQEKKLQDIYGKDNNALNQAFKKVKLPEPPKDASFKEKLEFQVARYKAYEETLESPYHQTTLDDVATMGKSAVPVAVGLGLNLAVDLSIPFLLGNPLSLSALAAVSVASYAASEVASLGSRKLLDKTELNNTQKMVVDIAVRILAGAAVSGVASKVAGNMAAKELEKKAAKKAAREAEEAATRQAKAAARAARTESEVLSSLVGQKGVVEIIEDTDERSIIRTSFDASYQEGDAVRITLDAVNNRKVGFMEFNLGVTDTQDAIIPLDAIADHGAQGEIWARLVRLVRHHIKDLEDGTIIAASPNRMDYLTSYREKMYKDLFSLSDVQGQFGVQLGKIEEGSIEPFHPPDIDSFIASLG